MNTDIVEYQWLLYNYKEFAKNFGHTTSKSLLWPRIFLYFFTLSVCKTVTTDNVYVVVARFQTILAEMLQHSLVSEAPNHCNW